MAENNAGFEVPEGQEDLFKGPDGEVDFSNIDISLDDEPVDIEGRDGQQEQAEPQGEGGGHVLTAEEIDAAREQLYRERQAQIQRAEQEHQQRLAFLMQQEQLIQQRAMAQAQQVQQPEMNEFEKAVQAKVDERLRTMVAPELNVVRQQMAEQAQRAAIQNTLNAGMGDPNMPNFDEIAGMAITRFGKDVVMNRIMTSAPAEAARWMYQLGLAEVKATPMVQPGGTPKFQQHAAQSGNVPPKQATPQPNLPRGMQVQGGSATQAAADWTELDRRIERMSYDQLAEFRKNPANNKLYERMLRYGTTSPTPPKWGNY